MAKMQFEGIEEYLSKLKTLRDEGREMVGYIIYEGADVCADRIRENIQALPVAQKFAKKGEQLNTITAAQKRGLLDGFGISPMRQDGTFYNVKLGFAGYNGQKTHQYPNGQPNSVIARSICSGTSFRRANDFVGRAVRGEKSAVEKKMEEACEKFLASFGF